MFIKFLKEYVMRVKFKKVFDVLVKVLTFTLLLEPVWMLLPFAGFMYGSFIKLDSFYQNPFFACLTYFVFPVQTLMPLPIILLLLGVAIFFIGAIQIYAAKIKKSGLVQNGIYKKFRHPQYTGLIIFCIGFLLLWGRFITYILFSIMIISYYFLARKEERECLKLFSKEYKNYRKKTYFLLPGESLFKSISILTSDLMPNKTVRISLTLLLIQIFLLGTGFTILSIRKASMKTLPTLSGNIVLENGKKLDLNIINGSNYKNNKDLGDILQEANNKLSHSEKLHSVLNHYKDWDFNTLLGFSISRVIRQKKEYYGKYRSDLFLIAVDSSIPLTSDNFINFEKGMKIKGAFQINEIDFKNISNLKEIILGDIQVIKAYDGKKKTKEYNKIEGYLNGYLYSFNDKVLPLKKLIEKY